MRTGCSLANAEGEQNLWAKGNSWKKSFKPQTGMFLEGVPLCPRDIGQGMGGAGPSAGAKASPGLRGFLVLFWANLDSLGALGKPLPVVQASLCVWERPRCH